MSYHHSNRGYIGNSRSVRSAYAIEEFRIPLSHFKKSVIRDFLNLKLREIEEFGEDAFTIDNINTLKNTTVNIWKDGANKVGTREWHHTGSYFSKTYHYDLEDIAIYILDNLEELKKTSSKNRNIDFTYGVMEVQEWGGTRKHPKLLGNKIVAGIVIGDWLYDIKDNTKYKTTANKVNWLETFCSYSDLTKKHTDYKNTKKLFNNKIKEKINK